MEQFAYSFAITLMHSVWQMALLLLLYSVITRVLPQCTPLAKRNLLFLVLGAQVFSSVLSFYIVYSEPFTGFGRNIQSIFSSLASSQSWLHSYAETLSLAYAAIVCYKLSASFIQWISFQKHYKTALVKPSIDLRLFTQTKAYHFGISKKVTIWYSENIHSPMTFGFLKPVILLPLALVNQLSIQQTESLIIHELTHIRNQDFLLNWFLLISEAVYFFNPFVKIVANKIRLEREKNCDLQVLRFDYPPISYAETLLKTAQQQQSSYSLQLSAVKNKAELLDRIRFFTGSPALNNPRLTKFPFAVAAIVLLVMLNLAFAGYLMKDKKISNAPLVSTGIFSSVPANDWNKSFTVELPFTNNQDAPSSNESRLKKRSQPPVKLAVHKQSLKSSDGQQHFTGETDFQPYEEFYATPASVVDQSPVQQNELIIKEEISSGKIVTKFYQVKTVNGELLLEPLWMTAELLPTLVDSLKLKSKSDSSHLFKLIPTIQ